MLAILKKFLRIRNILNPSFWSVSIHSLFVTSAAALYTRNVINRGMRLKSMISIPRTNGSTALVIVLRSELRDVVASE